MFEKKKQAEHKPRDDGVELENQFIMRFPKVGSDAFVYTWRKELLIYCSSSFLAPCHSGS